jgi:hypothetical protein
VLVAVLIEADKQPDEPEDYAGYIDYLHNAESQIPARQQALREAQETSQ